MDPIQAIVFDAYGTLFNLASIDGQLQARFGEKAATVAAAWRRKQLEYTWLRSLMGRYVDFYTLTGEALDFACQQADVLCEEEVRAGLLSAYYKLSAYPEVAPALSELSGSYRLAILSNANPSLLERAMSHNNLEDLIPDIFSADSVEVYKPSPSVYQLAVEGLKVRPSEILFVSSNTWDVAGAASFGLTVAWLQRRAGIPEQLGFWPDLTVTNLRELKGAIRPGEALS